MKKLNKVIESYKTERGTFYRFSFQLRGIRVRRQGFMSYDEAQALMTRVRIDIFAGDYAPNKYFSMMEEDMTTRRFWDAFHMPKLKATIKESTIYTRRSALEKHFLSKLGHIKIRALDTNRMNRFFSHLTATGVSSSYQQSIWIGIKAMFRHAEELGFIDAQPKNKKPKRKHELKRILSADEMVALFAALEELKTEEEMKNIIRFMFFTGCRVGEAVAIREEDWLIDKQRINICRQRVHTIRKITSTKTGKNALIPLHPELMKVYENQMQLNKELSKKYPSNDGWFFRSSHKGGFISRDYIRTRLVAAAELAFGKDKAKGVSAHTLRRSIASLLVDKNIPIDMVASLLRHNVGTMLKHYNKANTEIFAEKFSEFSVDENAATK